MRLAAQQAANRRTRVLQRLVRRLTHDLDNTMQVRKRFIGQPIALQQVLVTLQIHRAHGRIPLSAARQQVFARFEIVLMVRIVRLLLLRSVRTRQRLLTTRLDCGNGFCAVNAGMRLKNGNKRIGKRFVGLDNGERLAALACAIQVRRGNVHICREQRGGDKCQNALLVVLMHYQRIAFARNLHAHAVDMRELCRAAAHRHAAEAVRGARRIHGFDVHRIGMVVLRLGKRHNVHIHPCFLRQGEGIANTQVIGRKPQHSRHQGAVGTMPRIRVRE